VKQTGYVETATGMLYYSITLNPAPTHMLMDGDSESKLMFKILEASTINEIVWAQNNLRF
jgi:hypothetical protein